MERVILRSVHSLRKDDSIHNVVVDGQMRCLGLHFFIDAHLRKGPKRRGPEEVSRQGVAWEPGAVQDQDVMTRVSKKRGHKGSGHAPADYNDVVIQAITWLLCRARTSDD